MYSLMTSHSVNLLIGISCCICCIILCCSVNKTEIICTTPSVANAGILPVMVSFDEIVRDLQMDFEYAEDPSITRLQPLTAFRRFHF